MTTLIDPAKLEFCPCGAQIQPGKGYFCCRPCWLSAPEYFRIKFSTKTGFAKEQAMNQILNHARRRAKP